MSTIPPVTDPRFDPDYGQPAEPKQKRGPWATCLIGCLVVLVILLILGSLVAFWVAQNFRGWATDVLSAGTKQIIESSDLPQQEKAEINAQIDRVADAYRAGRLSNAQVGVLLQKLVESPLMASLAVAAVEQKYFVRSGLTEEEKAAGRVTLMRFARGIIDDKIDEEELDKVLQHVAVRQQNGNWRLRNEVSDDDLKAMLAAAKTAADVAGIPEQPPAFDPSEEFKRIVDEALAQPEVAAEAPMPNDSTEPKSAE